MNDATDTNRLGSRFRGFLPVVVDVETAGFNPKRDALLEIAAVILGYDESGQLKPVETVACHVEPFPGANLEQAVARLADRVDMIYLHVDADILDQSYVPSHRTKEPNGPDIDQVLAAIDCVMATGKVIAYAVVSVYYKGPRHEVDLASGVELVRGGLSSWQRYGMSTYGKP